MRPIIVKPQTKSRTQSQSNYHRSHIIHKPASKTFSKTTKFDESIDLSNVKKNEEFRDFLLSLEHIKNLSNIIKDYDEIQIINVIPYLREYAHTKGRNEDYDSAQKAVEIMELLTLEIKNRNENENNPPKFENEKNEIEINFETKWKTKFVEFENETKSKREALLEEHKKQKEEFEKDWNLTIPNKYRKPSQQLLQLKRIEKNFAASADFQKAKEIHARAEILMKQEMEIAQKKMMEDYEHASKKLIEKQTMQINTFETAREHSKMLLNSKYTNERTSLNNRKRILQTRKLHEKRYNSINQSYQSNIHSSCLRNDSPTNNENEKSVMKCDLVLLPPLKPPNDPKIKEEKKKKKREIAKKKAEYQKQNAELTLLKYTVNDSNIYSKTKRNQSISLPNNDNQNPKKVEALTGHDNISRETSTNENELGEANEPCFNENEEIENNEEADVVEV